MSCSFPACIETLKIAKTQKRSPQVVRDDDVIFQSPHQQHSFNFPYQLGRQEVDAASESPARAQVRATVLFSPVPVLVMLSAGDMHHDLDGFRDRGPAVPRVATRAAVDQQPAAFLAGWGQSRAACCNVRRWKGGSSCTVSRYAGLDRLVMCRCFQLLTTTPDHFINKHLFRRRCLRSSCSQMTSSSRALMASSTMCSQRSRCVPPTACQSVFA